MTAHIIHLRGPWNISALARTRWSAEGVSVELDSVELDGVDRVELPVGGQLNPVGSWAPLLGEFRGRVLYERPLRCPTGLAGKSVWLVVEGVDAMADASLNNTALGSINAEQTLRVEISQRLQPQNRLALIIDLPSVDDDSAPLPRVDRASAGRTGAASGGLIGGVRLEIE